MQKISSQRKKITWDDENPPSFESNNLWVLKFYSTNEQFVVVNEPLTLGEESLIIHSSYVESSSSTQATFPSSNCSFTLPLAYH